MASERLSHVLQSFASALADANDELAAQHDERVSYLITELDAALTYGRLELGEQGAMVDLDDRGQEGTGRVIRLRIAPVPQPARDEPEVPEGPDPRDPTDIKGLRLEEGLRAIALAGLPTDQVVIAFDPGSERGAGEILDYKVERDGTSGTPRFVFTVAGTAPKGGKLGGRFGGLLGGGVLGGGVLGGRPGGDVRPPRPRP